MWTETETPGENLKQPGTHSLLSVISQLLSGWGIHCLCKKFSQVTWLAYFDSSFFLPLVIFRGKNCIGQMTFTCACPLVSVRVNNETKVMGVNHFPPKTCGQHGLSRYMSAGGSAHCENRNPNIPSSFEAFNGGTHVCILRFIYITRINKTVYSRQWHTYGSDSRT